jgi:putative hydrolase of the HAD superfamily
MNALKVIAFDADDTLWVNEPYFRETEEHFCKMLEDFLPQHSTNKELYKTEIGNLDLLGYGTKSFIISMIETAMQITQGNISHEMIQKIIDLGKEQLNKPVVLLDGIEDVLSHLHGRIRLVMATKGELMEQEAKLMKSGLDHFFHHIEIVSEKNKRSYAKLIKHLDVKPNEFLMVGNSVKSDILPVLELGGNAIHIPYHTTWEHERVDVSIEHDRFRHIEHISEVLDFIQLP